MDGVDISLRRIAQVQEAASDVGSAYLIRTRLHRMVVSIQRRLDSALAGDGVPTLDAEVTASRVRELLRDIVASTRHMSQRSESLDDRWTREWRSLEGQLDELEIAVRRHWRLRALAGE